MSSTPSDLGQHFKLLFNSAFRRAIHMDSFRVVQKLIQGSILRLLPAAGCLAGVQSVRRRGACSHCATAAAGNQIAAGRPLQPRAVQAARCCLGARTAGGALQSAAAGAAGLHGGAKEGGRAGPVGRRRISMHVYTVVEGTPVWHAWLTSGSMRLVHKPGLPAMRRAPTWH